MKTKKKKNKMMMMMSEGQRMKSIREEEFM
jgi:hypothetical protein